MVTDRNFLMIFEGARKAARALALIPEQRRDDILRRVADAAIAAQQRILDANKYDLDQMALDNPLRDRLALSPERLAAIADDIRHVAQLHSPVGDVLREWTQPNGLRFRKVAVPFGVVGVIYEARPNVTFDVFSLCFKTANACVLKGGADAAMSNHRIVSVIRKVLEQEGIDPNVISLTPATHQSSDEMLHATGLIDVIIPRGSRRLIDYVRRNAQVPIIETGAGICHAYFHSSADTAKGAAIINNAKTRRVSVCNALDCLLIDRSRIADLPAAVAPLAAKDVVIYADDEAFNALSGQYPLLEHAQPETWDTEWMDYKMAVHVVADLDEALAHIATHGSGHSECIIADDEEACNRFTAEVDAACVYTNAPTSWTDGAQFGFGAEIGISTQKLHARGPMALPELCTYKYIITGDAQLRP